MNRNEPIDVYKNDDGIIHRADNDEIVTCSWFAMCANDATDLKQHPVLGGVPICEICKACA